MAEIRLVLTGVDNATDDIKKASASVTGLQNIVSQSKMSWTELNSAIGVVSQGLGYVKQAYDAVIAPTLEYAGQVRTLSRTIGQSAEETSRLIQITDDMQIEYSDLATAARVAAKNGILRAQGPSRYWRWRASPRSSPRPRAR